MNELLHKCSNALLYKTNQKDTILLFDVHVGDMQYYVNNVKKIWVPLYVCG